ncbi:MAG TPA: response regulator transcription factor [Mesotoga infera]|nr:response regulator transcription factor [Mesotoga infera]HRR44327.1 response regulator transcription factor [Mesotoga sp.]HNS66197.1 response regulator transcription factor [Mesotoga infera]HOI35689.1 response regulator transcription factor [Mesotoga infera]HPD36711.1 response regulator transcription factor [Mesotoga infera]
MKILFADDERNMRILVSDFLEMEGYKVLLAVDGEEALQKFYENPDLSLIILDIMMPRMSGIEVLEEIRERCHIPVIMLTAKSAETDELEGFQCGADEYISKPFSPRILVARVNALLRRSYPMQKETKIGVLHVKPSSMEVYVNDRRIVLSRTEFNLLSCFVANSGITLTRDQLLDSVWGYDYQGTDRTVDTHINRLRSKLQEASEYIETIRGYGYRFGVRQ